MLALLLVAPTLGTGCFYTCDDCVRAAELDGLVAAAGYSKGAGGDQGYTKEELYTRAEVDAIVAQAVEDALAEADTRYEPEGDFVTAAEVSDHVRVLSADPAYTVTSEAELLAALADLDRYRIPAGLVATINVADGLYTMSGPLVIEHPDGARIALVGNVVDPAAVELQFPAGGDGIVVAKGQALGYLGGLLIKGGGPEEATSGLKVEVGGNVVHGPLAVSGWGRDVEVYGGTLVRNQDGFLSDYADGVLTLSNCGTGAWVRWGGVLLSWEAAASGFHDYGFSVEVGSVADLMGAEAAGTGASTAGVSVNGLAYVSAYGMTSTDNTSDGFVASSLAYLDARDATASDNVRHGFFSVYGSMIDASTDSVASTNLGGGFVATMGAILHAEDAVATDNGSGGFLVSSAAVAEVNTSVAELHDSGPAFYAGGGSFMVANGVTAEDNLYGFYQDTHSLLFAPGSITAGNGTDDYALGDGDGDDAVWSWLYH